MLRLGTTMPLSETRWSSVHRYGPSLRWMRAILLTVLVIASLPSSQQQQLITATASNGTSTAAGLNAPATPNSISTDLVKGLSSLPQANSTSSAGSKPDAQKLFNEFKQSPYFVEPFEDGLMSIPEPQVQFVREASARDFALFRQITKDAIDRRGKFGSSVALMMKYTAKLLSSFIRNRQMELALKEFKDPKSEFFDYMADLISRSIERSTAIKREKPYTKNNVDSKEFYERVDGLFAYFTKILNKSPLGMYLKWGDLKMYKDDPKNPRHNVSVMEEASELFAQMRAMGYESATFVAKRIVNMLHLFAKSKVPSVNDV